MAAVLVVVLVSSLGPVPGAAPALQRPEDDEEAAYREAAIRRSFQENCLICHTEDLIAGQRLTPAQWKAEVDKMVNWGAPLPPDAEGPLVEYLARHYSDREPPAVPERAPLAGVDSLEIAIGRDSAVSEAADPARGERLYAAQCATCHGAGALGADLGPALVGKAILDRRREYDRIVDQGLRRMPGFRTILNAKDQADVLAWLRRRAYPEPSMR
jgi:mono/diheme cytochrome c family protein